MATGDDLERIETLFGPLWTRRDDFVNAQLREFGAHQRNELAMLLSFVREGDTVLDVGAHIGTFSLPLASRVGSAGRVYAFEGCPESFAILEKNIALNQKGAVAVPTLAVVTDEPGDYEIHLKSHHTSAAFFSRRSTGPESEGASPCVHLDTWWEAQHPASAAVHVIKIDTEGMELRVLRSARRLIERHRPILYAEISVDQLARQGDPIRDIASFLRGFGYHLFRNDGVRNSATDDYRIRRLWRLAHGGSFFDVLAVHPGSARYPKAYAGGAGGLLAWAAGRGAGVLRRLRNVGRRALGSR